MEKVYAIRRKSDGLFSSGGGHPKFKKTGKIWTRVSDLKNHLNLVNIKDYQNCEIVLFELNEKNSYKVYSLNEDLRKRIFKVL